MAFDPSDYEVPGVPSTPATTPPATDPMTHAMSRMQSDYGWSPHIAAGIVGNLWHESQGGNPLAVGDGGKSFGLAQWNAERRRALADFATSQGKPASDFDVQLDFVNHELSQSPEIIDALHGTQTPAEAARTFSRLYERPGKPMMGSRLSHAERAFQLADKIAATVPTEAEGFNPADYEIPKAPEGDKFNPADYEVPKAEARPRPGLLDVPKEELTPAGRVTQMGERIFDAYVPGMPIPVKGAAERFESLGRGWKQGWSHFYGDFLGNLVGGFTQRLSEMKAGMPERERFGVDKTSPVDVVAPVVDYVKQIAEKIAPKYSGRGDLQDKIFEGLGSAPAAFAKYTLGIEAGGPVAGMALVGAITSANKEPVDRLKEVLADTVMGVGFKAVEPLTVMSKATTLAGMGAMQAKLEGGNATDVAAGAATMFMLGVSAHGGNVSAKEALIDSYRQFSKKYNKLPEREQVQLRDWIQEEQFSGKMEELKRQYESDQAAALRAGLPGEVKKPLPTPEETTAEVERLKREYRAGQEHPILTETLSPEALQAIREGKDVTPDIDDKITRALTGERSHPASPAGVAWESDFPPTGIGEDILVKPEPKPTGMPDYKGREVEVEAKEIARQQQFMEQHRDLAGWYEDVKREKGEDAAGDALRLYLSEKVKDIQRVPVSTEAEVKAADRLVQDVADARAREGIEEEGVTPMFGGGPDTSEWLKDHGPFPFWRVRGRDARTGKTFDYFLRDVKDTGNWVRGIQVDREGNDIFKEGKFDESIALIDKRAISSMNDYREHKRYGTLEPVPAYVKKSGVRYGGGPDTSELLKKMAPVWYSRMQRFLADPKVGLPERGTGEQFANLAEQWAKKGQFKQSEYEWSGLGPWLREQKGKVTRGQVEGFLKENQVEVREVEKGSAISSDEWNNLSQRVQDLRSQKEAADAEAERFDKAMGDDVGFKLWNHDPLTPEEQSNYDKYRQAARARDDIHKQLIQAQDTLYKMEKGYTTKFQSYMKLPPGGENYREILLGVPAGEVVKEPYIYNVYSSDGTWLANVATKEEAARYPNMAYFEEIDKGYKTGVGQFQVPSSHAYGDPAADVNRFAHIFVDDRVIDGKKYLTVHELQSDWRGQRMRAAEDKVADDAGISRGDTAKFNEFIRQPENRKKVTELFGSQEAVGGVPAFPMQGNWHEVALKKVLRKAAEEGYDGVAWATGDMVKERYDLSRQLSRVDTAKNEDGSFDISAKALDGNEYAIASNVHPDKLSDYVGKDLADKIVQDNKQFGYYEGVDLKIGGEWANRQYDQMMPQFLGKYGKQWGARVGEGKLEGRPAVQGNLIPVERRPGEVSVVDRRWPTETPFETFDSFDEANDYIRERESERFEDWIQGVDLGHMTDADYERAREEFHRERGLSEIPPSNIHTLPFTPEMKESVLYKGQPMFSGGPDYSQWFRDIGDRIRQGRESGQSRVDFTDLDLKAKGLFGGLKGLVSGPPVWTDFKDLLGKYLGARQVAALENYRQINRINKAIPERTRQEAITNWIEAGGDRETLRRRAELTTDPRLKKGYEAAMQLAPEETALGHEVVGYFDRMLKEGQEAGILEDALDNYITHIWKKDSPTAQRLQAEVNAGLLNTNFNYARKRLWSTYFEGEQTGKVPKNKEVSYLLGRYHQSFYEALAARKAVKSLMDGKASDGMPLVTTVGGMPLQRVPEETRPFSEVPGEYDMTARPTSDQPYLVRPNKVTEEQFRNYQPLNHPALRKWKWIGNDLDGRPVLLQGDMWVHKEFRGHLKNVLGKSAIRQSVLGRGILGGVQSLKTTLLSMSGFHQVQEGLHAVFHKVNPMNTPELDLNNPIQRDLVNHGLMVFDYNAMQNFSEGLYGTGLVNKIPVLGPLAERYGHYLFQDYIPRLKMKMATDALERNIERYTGKYNMDQILEMTANQSNAAFGELNYKMMGRNPTVQDMFRLIALAPDFLEARAKFVGQAFKAGGREQAAALLRGAIGLYGLGVIGNMLVGDDKKPHWEKPFTLVIGGHDYTLRSVPGDLIHLMKDPRNFAYWRLNPTTIRTAVEYFTGRDAYGQKRNVGQQVRDFFVAHTPIPVQGLFNTKREQTLFQSALQSIGVASYKHRTGAEQVMMDYFTEYRVDRPATSEMIDLNRTRRQVVQMLRSGQPKAAMDKVRAYAKEHKVNPTKVVEWLEESGQPENVVSFKRLPVDWMAKTLQKAEPEEEKAFLPIFLDKIGKASPEKIEAAMPEIQKYVGKKKPRRGQDRFSILD